MRVLVGKSGWGRAARDGYRRGHEYLHSARELAGRILSASRFERLNRPQTVIDLLVADVEFGKARLVLSEKDLYWINVSDDLTFLKDGKRFLWSSEKIGLPARLFV